MPPIEMGPARPIGAIDVRLARQASGLREQTGQTGSALSSSSSAGTATGVALSGALDAGEAPIDTDRVSVIRKAVESGSYPIVPAKIADALIAAGMLLRKGE